MINNVAYKLDLTGPCKGLHPVFHSGLLKPYVEDPDHPKEGPPPPVYVEAHDFPTYHIDEIIEKRTRRGKVEYLIHWKGQGELERTWEPGENIQEDAPIQLQEFEEEQRPGGSWIMERQKVRRRRCAKRCVHILNQNMCATLRHSASAISTIHFLLTIFLQLLRSFHYTS